MRSNWAIYLFILSACLTLLAGCAAVSPDQPASPLDAVVAPHLPLLAWQKTGDGGEGGAASCRQLYVYLGNAAAGGPCGHTARLPAPLDPIFAEMVARFAPFTYQEGQEQLIFRGYGSIAALVWQRAILAWVRGEAGKLVIGEDCGFICHMALNWSLGEAADQPGVCRALWVLDYGLASAVSFSCSSGEAIGPSGWLRTTEWEYIEGLLATHSPLQRSDSSLRGVGVQSWSAAELDELDAVARRIFARLQSEPQPAAAPAALPVRVPTPTPDATVQQTAAAVMAAVQPVTTTFTAPDGQAQVEIVMYGCAWTAQGVGHAYELVRLATGANAARQVDSQLINCDGLGAYGFAALCWSTDYRYFYYTKTREGVPDGAGDWVVPLYELEVSNGLVRERDIMAESLSYLSAKGSLLCASALP
jgi:hypothetical protein